MTSPTPPHEPGSVEYQAPSLRTESICGRGRPRGAASGSVARAAARAASSQEPRGGLAAPPILKESHLLDQPCMASSDPRPPTNNPLPWP
eukprot:10141568-Karenia_brevis.AAC.1